MLLSIVGRGGNYFVTGGAVKGGQILGEYPREVKAGSYLNLGRGRMLPTTSWEGIWNGVAEWMDLDPDRMDTVMPNRHYFKSHPGKLLTKQQMYKH